MDAVGYWSTEVCESVSGLNTFFQVQKIIASCECPNSPKGRDYNRQLFCSNLVCDSTNIYFCSFCELTKESLSDMASNSTTKTYIQGDRKALVKYAVSLLERARCTCQWFELKPLLTFSGLWQSPLGNWNNKSHGFTDPERTCEEQRHITMRRLIFMQID